MTFCRLGPAIRDRFSDLVGRKLNDFFTDLHRAGGCGKKVDTSKRVFSVLMIISKVKT